MGFLYPWHVRNVCSILGPFSRSYGLRCSGIRSVLLKTHQHFDSTNFMLHLCPRVGSQLIHFTNTFKLKSVASDFVEYRSTCTAERDLLPPSQTCLTDMIDFCNPVFFGRNLKITRNLMCANNSSCCRVSVNSCPVDLCSTQSPLCFLPKFRVQPFTVIRLYEHPSD